LCFFGWFWCYGGVGCVQENGIGDEAANTTIYRDIDRYFGRIIATYSICEGAGDNFACIAHGTAIFAGRNEGYSGRQGVLHDNNVGPFAAGIIYLDGVTHFVAGDNGIGRNINGNCQLRLATSQQESSYAAANDDQKGQNYQQNPPGEGLLLFLRFGNRKGNGRSFCEILVRVFYSDHVQAEKIVACRGLRRYIYLDRILLGSGDGEILFCFPHQLEPLRCRFPFRQNMGTTT
jgi:hypothetical protein